MQALRVILRGSTCSEELVADAAVYRRSVSKPRRMLTVAYVERVVFEDYIKAEIVVIVLF